MVGESAGSIAGTGIGDPGRANSRSGTERPRSTPAATGAETSVAACKLICKRCFISPNCAKLLTDLDGVADFRFPFAHHSGERRLNRINGFVGFDFAQFIIERDGVARFFQTAKQFSRCEFLRP